MKKTFVILLLISAILLTACNAAKKPEPQQNNTLIVPEVTTIDFKEINLNTAPKAIRDIAKGLEKQDATSWANSEDKSYLIISQGDKTKDFQLEVDQILQRMPETGFTWLDIKLDYKKNSATASAEESPITIIRADVNSLPDGVAFTITGLTANEAPKKITPAEKKPSPSTPPAAKNPGASIKQPSANQEITSPVAVQGSTTVPEQQIRVRLITRGGQIIKEESVAANRATGEFNKEIKYNPPSSPTPGQIEILTTLGDNEKILTGIPVIIK